MALAEILSQEEINALLAAISGGDDPGAPESPRVAAVPQPERRAEPRGRVRPYDFARPNKLSKDQLRTLQCRHEPFARGIAPTLSGSLRSYGPGVAGSAAAMT